ncbi:fumarylacetoacetate hydrolase family protein [Aeromicrobium sp. Sec7.5]|uniref:fumarylacetoacetate hydrolase family protein n=1 Tax=Aeromicrobium sp. Sec7.5 TaxID=3121276 RepID=UPI002FE4E2B7
MRLAAISTPDGWAIGAVEPDLASVRVAAPSLGTVDDVVRGRVTVQEVVDHLRDVPASALSGVTLGSPVQQFNRDVLCTGWNYLDHFFESEGKREGQDPEKLPEHPTFFTKGPDTVVGPSDPIAFDERISAKWDYEAEIALVIGRDGRSIREEDAWSYVFGYMVANDVSQRDLQRAHGGQWLKGKSIDDTMPLGPWLTTADEVENFGTLQITCELNGELLQNASASDMAFSVPRIIAELSRGMTLRAGDVILTGTPSGIGNAREPAIFLAQGDVVVTRVDGLGEMRNVMTATALVESS